MGIKKCGGENALEQYIEMDLGVQPGQEVLGIKAGHCDARGLEPRPVSAKTAVACWLPPDAC